MKPSSEKKSMPIGRAKTILVFKNGANNVAVVSEIVVRTLESQSLPRLTFTGPANFDPGCVAHVNEIILPIIDELASYLGIGKTNYEVSAVNIGAAAYIDIGLNINGFSADTSIFLAMLSATLKMSIPENLVSTGHIASTHGDIRFVGCIPEKLDAAIDDNTITAFVYPNMEADASVKNLTASEMERTTIALINAREEIQTYPVDDIIGLVTTVISDEEIVHSHINTSCRLENSTNPEPTNCVEKTADYLGRDFEERFVNLLETYFYSEKAEQARKILEKWFRVQVNSQSYPSGFGTKLYRLIQSLPPPLFDFEIKMPVISIETCVKLGAYIHQDSDYADIQYLNELASTKFRQPPVSVNAEKGTTDSHACNAISITVDRVLREIGKDSLVKKFSIPIDTARSTYVLKRSMVSSSREFYQVLASYYLHLQRHIGAVVGTPEFAAAGPDAKVLLERAYERRNGSKVALVHATNGTDSGMRGVLDNITDQFKIEQQESYITYVLANAINELDWDEKVKFMKEFMDRCAPLLPLEITSQPPQRFAKHYGNLIRLYVESQEQLKEYFRTL